MAGDAGKDSGVITVLAESGGPSNPLGTGIVGSTLD